MKKFSEDKCTKLGKEKSELSNQLDENEEELQEVIRKYNNNTAMHYTKKHNNNTI